MSRYTGPKIRLSRRLGVQLFGRKDEKTKKYNLARKNYAPGQHGLTKIGKLSEYGKQLAEKQKVRFMFGLTEKQMRNYYVKATKSATATNEELMRLIESRIDNVIFRAGWGKTRAQCRQMVNHALINLNGKKIRVPSIQIKIGDTFEVRTRSKNSPLFRDTAKSKINSVRWLEVDTKNLSGKVISLPKKDDFEKIVDTQLVLEYYSK
ncbi:30S ribosomal protein S4 [Candidatus Peregrinibacteria bacterium]|nr:30S ribosomal protein S4 [Candidatus Peregrinibacteria bacterium]